MAERGRRFGAWRLRRKERRLTYCYKRCPCGALYAIDNAKRAWDCSDIILGLAIPKGEPGSATHDDTMPFIFWKVKEAPRDWALEHRVERPVDPAEAVARRALENESGLAVGRIDGEGNLEIEDV